jgi:hypothetical protein
MAEAFQNTAAEDALAGEIPVSRFQAICSEAARCR